MHSKDLLILLTGFTSSFIQIVAIGAQNTFVLKSSVSGRGVLMVPLLCCICDIFLISLSIFGVAGLIVKNVYLMRAFQYGGAVFLLCYGFKALKSSFKDQKRINLEYGGVNYSSKSIILATIAVSLLNPHAWLDTVVIIGSLSSEYTDKIERIYFYTGSIFASIIWFFGLSLAARLAAPVFTNSRSWKILDLIIGIFMLALALKLLF